MGSAQASRGRQNDYKTAWLFVASVVALCATGRLHAQPAGESGDGLRGSANTALGLRASEVVCLNGGVPAGGPAKVLIPTRIGGEPHVFELLPTSIRADDFQVLVQLADGTYEIAPVPPPRTYRGVVSGLPGSAVAATLADEGVYARILLADGGVYWMEPLLGIVAEAGPGEHVVYRGDDVTPSGGVCGVEPRGLPHVMGEAESGDSVSSPGGSVSAGSLFIAELAVDADVEFFQVFGTVDAVTTRIESTINGLNLEYERDVQIRHVITTIIVRTAEPDPYPSLAGFPTLADAVSLLASFRNHWMASQGAVRRDMAQLFTGKNLVSNVTVSDPNGDPSTIGIAYLGQVCLSNGHYSVVERICPSNCSNLACTTDLSAHELGHTWSAEHCCPNTTMWPSLTCSNVFAQQSVSEIVNHRDSRTMPPFDNCLDQGDELRRIIVTAPTNSIAEGGLLQLSAIADFLYGDDQDVTGDTVWTVDPPTAGFVDATGIFFPAEVHGGDLCVTITASYTSEGITRTAAKRILVIDADVVRAITLSNPPDGAIDARQPFNPDGTNPTGIKIVDLTYNGDTCLLTSAEFLVTQEGGVITPPTVLVVTSLGARSVRVFLSDVIEPGARTTITDQSADLSISVSSLPGDVDADGVVTLNDVSRLIDGLSGVGDPLSVLSSDIDRSGVFAALDAVRLADLLNGGGNYEVWLGRFVP